MTGPRQHSAADDGSMVMVVGVVLALALAMAVLLVDVAAYLLAAARAQAAADAAARAAVAITDPRGQLSGDARADAATVASAAGATLVRCSCRDGDTEVAVEVGVRPPTTILHRFAAREVTASAAARLAEPVP